ncbi:hypothetical protein CYMTET_6751 [Cymbomonas tetramitiformis]|uniref:Uncharacterized protein n=1 Tax=Cymbomonas tetramitiformis TaxID=36881 RepID=A0AAE0LHS1_9CHLO|nr:hypothetical protein CYMTET_6751 [Cymbomonas tetramitiformis]
MRVKKAGTSKGDNTHGTSSEDCKLDISCEGCQLSQPAPPVFLASKHKQEPQALPAGKMSSVNLRLLEVGIPTAPTALVRSVGSPQFGRQQVKRHIDFCSEGQMELPKGDSHPSNNFPARGNNAAQLAAKRQPPAQALQLRRFANLVTPLFLWPWP